MSSAKLSSERTSGATDRALIVESTPLYRSGRMLTRLFLKVLSRYRVEGHENVPTEGPALLVSNHQSFLDIPLIAGSNPKRHVCFVARESLARSRFLGYVMRRSGAVLIHRGKPDRAALRDMIEHLRQGDLVAIFPEGTRSETGRVGEFRGGALLAARQARVPIVPVGIRGTSDVWPKGRSLPRPAPVLIRFGEAVDPTLPDALERVHGTVVDLVGDGHAPRR